MIGFNLPEHAEVVLHSQKKVNLYWLPFKLNCCIKHPSPELISILLLYVLMMRKTLTFDTLGWFPLNLAGGINSIYNYLIYGNLRLLSVTSQLIKGVSQGWVMESHVICPSLLCV